MIKLFADWLTYEVFKIGRDTVLAGAVIFFIYDTIKIFLLLIIIIFIVSLIRSFFSPEKTRAMLTGKGKYTGNVLASLLGVMTPFCSCSAVPLFLGFVEAGIPLGVTFSFLVASPMINEVALIMLWGMFGWKIAILYIGSGLVIAIFSGIIIGQMKVDNLIETFVFKAKASGTSIIEGMTFKDRVSYAVDYTLDILKGIWPYVVIGIGLGAWIHGYVPQDFLAKYAGADKWYAVPLAVLLGVPLYSNAAGVIPLVSALTEKGVAIGTALAFMMSVTALSLPEFMILKKVMKIKLILIFAGVVATGIIFTGYIFNILIK